MKNLIKRLTDYYQNLNRDNLHEVVTFMNTDEMKNIYDRYIEMIINNEEIGNDELELLEIILRLTNSIYTFSGNETGLSDSDYDILVEYYRDKTKNDNFFTEKNIDIGVVSHKYVTLRGTLDKIYKLTDDDELKNKSQRSIDDWVKSTERRIEDRYGKKINIFDSDILLMPKFDGLSVVIEFSKFGKPERALLRGDTETNESKDVLHILKDIIVPPITDSGYEYGLKTEVMMSEENFNKYNETYGTNYKNSRSIVSSILNSDEADERVKYLTIVPLRIAFYMDGEESIQEIPDTFFNYPYLRCKLKDLEEIHKFSFEHKYADGLRCDGSVIVLTDPNLQKYLGRENDKNKFEVAFKFTEEVGYSEVLDVVFNTSVYGTLNPVVKFKPIKLKGNTIENASLGSYARFKDLGLSKGDIIKISYDIIPYPIFDWNDSRCVKSGNKTIEPPLICSECGTRFIEVGVDGSRYMCPNKTCPCKKRGKILNYCKKMGIEMVSEATVDDLYNNGFVSCIEDLYKLENYRNELCQLPGYKARKVDKIIKSINDVKEVPPSKLFGSFGIPSIGEKKFQNIFQLFSVEDVIMIVKTKTPIAFTVCKGIKDRSAETVFNGIQDNIDEIMSITKYVKLTKEPRALHPKFKVVFSKTRNEELEQYIIESGGGVSNNVSKITNFVVVPNRSVTSTKIEKAIKLGIPIVLESEVVEYIHDNYPYLLP